MISPHRASSPIWPKGGSRGKTLNVRALLALDQFVNVAQGVIHTRAWSHGSTRIRHGKDIGPAYPGFFHGRSVAAIPLFISKSACSLQTTRPQVANRCRLWS